MAKKEWLGTGEDGLTFGERLGDLISSRGINQSYLATETGVAQSAISEYINGKQNGTSCRAPDCATIITLAKYFSVSTDYLLGLTKIKSTNEDVQAVCAVTGLRDDNIYDLMGLTNPKDAVYLREMVNEFLSFAVDDCAICTYKAFRKYIDLDNQRWDETQQLTEGEYQDKLEKLRQLSAEAEKHGYQIMSYNESAEKEWQKLCDEYGKFLLKQYRSFDTQSDTENSKEACDGTY